MLDPRPLPKKFLMQGGWRSARIEHEGDGRWRVWLAGNASFTIGSFLRLHPDGKIERVTLRTTGEEDIFVYDEGADDEQRN